MSLKAGRVGVAPDQVDLFGNIIGGGSGGDAYTKAESDAKFETITNAASTYLTKTDAASDYLTKTDASNTYQAKGTWTNEVKVSAQSADYGDVYFSENVNLHLAYVRFVGSAAGAAAVTDEVLDLSEVATERPIADYFMSTCTNTSNGILTARYDVSTSKVQARLQIPASIGYSRGYIIYPTKSLA